MRDSWSFPLLTSCLISCLLCAQQVLHSCSAIFLIFLWRNFHVSSRSLYNPFLMLQINLFLHTKNLKPLRDKIHHFPHALRIKHFFHSLSLTQSDTSLSFPKLKCVAVVSFPCALHLPWSWFTDLPRIFTLSSITLLFRHRKLAKTSSFYENLPKISLRLYH